MSDSVNIHPTPQPAASQAPVSAFRLIGTLTFAGMMAGLLIVLVYQATLPTITAYREEQLQLAVGEVLGQPARVQRYYRINQQLTTELPAQADTGLKAVPEIFVGFDQHDRLQGVAIAHAEPGFQDLIHVIFGYHPDSGQLLGMKVLGHKETPGLGDKIIKDRAFVEQFKGAAVPLVGVKQGTAAKSPEKIDMITGATISSKAIIRIINHGLEDWQPLLDATVLQEVINP